ncbi:MAG: hypothetical protein EHM58_00130 [Ignavibacteriae bacterium]|nr:MAG: hypothetical protein EHM58_00130 [Ignavibacteriota bacterium]
MNIIETFHPFFQKEHYETFCGNKPSDDNADNERLAIADRLLELDNLLWPEILKHGWNISRHPQINHRSSTWQLSQARVFFEQRIDAIWLHYGKSDIELETYRPYHSDANPQTFIHHIRFQLVVRRDHFEIALILGKEKGGAWDRGKYHDLMENKSSRETLFGLITVLDSEYWIDFKSHSEYLNTFKTPEELWRYTRNDNINHYFTFGKSISPLDERISENNIVNTIIAEFKKLYPLYNLIKHRF